MTSPRSLLHSSTSEVAAKAPRGDDVANLQDFELVHRMARGHEPALAELYDRWAELVYSVAASIVGREDAEEVLEDTFWQAWRQAEQYGLKRGKVTTWLTMIARSRAIDRKRRRSRRQLRSWTEEDSNDGWANGTSPLAGAIEQEQRDIVERAIGRLPDDQRETVTLAYFHGLSQREIATRLDQPLGTVKTRVRLATAKLRRYLRVLSDTAL